MTEIWIDADDELWIGAPPSACAATTGGPMSPELSSLPEAVREQIKAETQQLSIFLRLHRRGNQEARNQCANSDDAIIAAMERVAEAAAQERAHFWLQTPSHQRDGIAPVETYHRCLYTQVKPCKQIYTDPDFWCGFCSETNLIPAASHPPPAPEDR